MEVLEVMVEGVVVDLTRRLIRVGVRARVRPGNFHILATSALAEAELFV